MESNPKNSRLSRPLLVAPDRATMRFMEAAFKRAGVPTDSVTATGRRAIAAARRAVRGSPALIVIAPAPDLGPGQIALAEEARENGGMVLGWFAESEKNRPASYDRWIIEELMEQKGAPGTSHLGVLTEAARIVGFLGRAPGDASTEVKGRSKELAARVTAIMRRAPVCAGAEKRRAKELVVEVAEDGKAALVAPGGRRLAVTDPSVTREALTMLSRGGRCVPAGKDPAFDPMQSEIDFIVRPPARLLSEVASKRLLAAFGIAVPDEALCHSPSEAVRFAERLGGAVVLKLVRPELEDKKRQGAVLADLKGAPAVRRAVHALRSLSATLGPPEALGILVAPQIEGGARIWLRLSDDPVYGRLVLVGSERISSDSPIGALRAPSTTAEARALLLRGGLICSDADEAKLAEAIAHFARLCDQLGQAVTRAEVSPLVAVDTSERALALDALIGIGG